MLIRNFESPPEVNDSTLQAFLRLYQLETWTREMVYIELKAYYGMDWWNEAEKALNRARVPAKLTTRYLAKDKQHPHISTPENDPLWFISFESLLKIIFDARLWKLFEAYFTTKKLLRVRFEEVLPIRNRVAHCRKLHAYDVARLEQLMRDFDQGFWRFCTSYNSRYRFADELSKNKVYDHFRSARTENLDVYYSVRPFAAARKPKPQLDRDFIYDATITTRHKGRYFDYERILKFTRSRHRFVLHIILDGFQHRLRLTFPATLSSDTIIETIDRFVDVAHNTYNIAPLARRVAPKKRSMPTEIGEPEKGESSQYDEANRPFQEIASRWPHYVIPPSHPYAFLDSECPCSFFSV